MITAPEVRSPYCAEGIPLITSTLSILSVEMPRRSTPAAGVEPTPTFALLPCIVAESICILALFERAAPSIITAVPRLFILAWASSVAVVALLEVLVGAIVLI